MLPLHDPTRGALQRAHLVAESFGRFSQASKLRRTDRFRAELDTLGEEEVRARLVLDVYGARKRPLVVDWLAQQAEGRQPDERERQELREDEALVLARRADKRAAMANLIAWIANATAYVAALIAVLAVIISRGK
jgi:hypothetical protein